MTQMQPPTVSQATASTEDWKTYSILIVDDEPNIVAQLELDLSLEGFNVITATSGEEGLKLLETVPAKVIVSDQKMTGGMDGTEFLRQAKQRHPHVVTMILSAFSEPKYILDAMNESRTFYYLIKPCEKEELIKRVTQALQFYDMNLKDRHRVERLNSLLVQSEKMASLAVYSSSLAHNIRNMILPFQAPLDVIEQDTLEIKAAPPEKRNELFEKYCDEIEEMVADSKVAIEHINDLIESILVVYRADQKESERFSLVDVIGNAIRLEKMRPIFDRIEIHFETVGKDFTIDALKGYLSSNVVEFLKNAGDAIAHKGEKARGNIWVKLEDTVNELEIPILRLEIRDDGCGMSEEVRKEIFAPLFTTKAGVGTGLGLAAVYEMVRMHGGTIEVHSAVGEGTTFTMVLPKRHKEKIIFDPNNPRFPVD